MLSSKQKKFDHIEASRCTILEELNFAKSWKKYLKKFKKCISTLPAKVEVVKHCFL